jgi:hypothetical protein
MTETRKPKTAKEIEAIDQNVKAAIQELEEY